MLHPLTILFSSQPIFILQQILLTISEPVINLTTLYLCYHPCNPSHPLSTPGPPMVFLLLFLLFHRTGRVILSNSISGYVTIQIKPSIRFLQSNETKTQTSVHYLLQKVLASSISLSSFFQHSLPCFLCSVYHKGLSAIAQTCQASSCLRTFELAVPSTWETLPLCLLIALLPRFIQV